MVVSSSTHVQAPSQAASPLQAESFGTVRHVANPRRRAGPFPDELEAVLGREDASRAYAEIRAWQGYARTPLTRLSGLGHALGLGAIHYKDEGGRFGLGSFKALGGAYAVLRLLCSELSTAVGHEVRSEDVLTGRHASRTAGFTVASATDGNHGRSVAWGASRCGCRSVIYIHAAVSEQRAEALRALGAEVVRVAGNYDDSVRQVAVDAERNGWWVVSDTSYPGYMTVPRDVMAGYMVLALEVVEQLAETVAEPPTHVIVQGGVGGVAAAVCAALWQAYGADRPRMLVVEPDRASCLLRSAQRGRASAVTIEAETVMAGLSCGEASPLAFQVLDAAVDDFLAVADTRVAQAMRLLAETPHGDPPIVAGESAVPGLVLLIEAAEQPALARRLGLDAASRVLLTGTEGATDEAIYTRMVGRSPAAVLGGQG
ncbi:MAG: diaminopropionate ammonia-lyase [Gammaproteobacteria bacterium]|nr:diaminopropionate ammonia-lyase [Gammaproteobacteria bacterium]